MKIYLIAIAVTSALSIVMYAIGVNDFMSGWLCAVAFLYIIRKEIIKFEINRL